MCVRTLIILSLLLHHACPLVSQPATYQFTYQEMIYIAPGGQTHFLDGYITHFQFMTLLDNAIAKKIYSSLTHALNSQRIDAGLLITNINTRQYIFLQLLHSLAVKDYSYSNILLEILPEKSDSGGYELKNNKEYVYNIVNNIVEGQSKNLINLPRHIALEIIEEYDFFILACSEGRVDIVKWYLELDDGYATGESLEVAWNNSRKEVVILLLEHIDLRRAPLQDQLALQTNSNNETLLHYAATIDNSTNVQVLINSGADVDAVDSQNRTPVYRAIEHGCHRVMNLLVESGAQINYGRSLLNIAVEKSNAEAVKLLLERSASPLPQENNGINLLRRSLEIIVVTVLRDLRKSIENDYQLLKLVFEEYFGLFECALSWGASGKASEDILRKQLGIFNLLKKIHSLDIDNDEGKLGMYLGGLKKFVLMKGRDAHVNAFVQILEDDRFYVKSDETELVSVEDGVSNETDADKILENVVEDENEGTDKSIYEAIRQNDISSTERHLLKNKYSWKTRDEDGLNPLYLAISLGFRNITDLFLSDNSNLDSILSYRDSEGRSPLFFAVHSRQEGIVSSLISKGAPLEELTDNNYTALHEAAAIGESGIVRLLVDAGASINVLTDNLYGPIHLAALSGHSRVAGYLVEKGADLGYSTANGTILHIAAAMCDQQLSEAIIQSFRVKGGSLSPRFAGLTPLHTAIMAKCLQVVIDLSTACALTMKEKTDTGLTAVHVAVGTADFDIINYFINAGADLNVKDNIGDSVLFRLARSSCKKNVRLAVSAISKGALVNTCGSEYKRPLHMACVVGGLEMVQLLVQNNADINAIDWYERTPLFTASMHGHYAIVYFLISRYANVNIGGRLFANLKVAPVRVAALLGHQQIANLLSANGAVDYVANYTGPVITSYRELEGGKLQYTTNWDPQLVNQFFKEKRSFTINNCQ